MKRVVKAPGACCNVLIFLLLALLVTCAPAWAAATVYEVRKVDSTNENITWTGSDGTEDDGRTETLTNLVKTLATGDGDTFTVNVGPGTYVLSNTLTLKKGVKLIGAGAENTILKGNSNFTIIECTAPDATTANTSLSGFTVTGGRGNKGSSYGGGMYISGASPAVINCTFADNEAGGGGGMRIKDGSPAVTNCTFSGNTAGNSGGGMQIMAGSPVVTNCTFAANNATCGGGMYISSGASPVVVNTILWGNTVDSDLAADGPDIYNDGGTVTLKNCVLRADGTNLTSIPSDCLTDDPKLEAVGSPIQYYNLGTGSSAIGAGLADGTSLSVTVPATDQLGNPRPGADGKVDIGAVEHDGVAPTPPSAPGPSLTPVDRSGATVTLIPTPGVELSGDRLPVDIPAGGSIAVTLRVTDWKDSRGNSVTPYEVRVFVGGVLRREARMSAKASLGGGVRGVTDTVTLTLTRADLDKLLEIKGHIAGDQWITQAFTVKQSGAVSPSLPEPTPTPDPAGPSDPTPTPTPDPTPADPTTPDSGGSSGGSGGGCQAMSFAQGLLALAALALLKRK